MLYLRTGAGGTGPLHIVDDLGFVVAPGVTFVPINAATPADPIGGDGYFTAVQIRDSADLLRAILDGDLEWSSDGISARLASDYDPDQQLVDELSDNAFVLTDGRLVLPTNASTGSILSPQPGEITFADGDGYFWGYDGYTWTRLGTDPSQLQDLAGYFRLTDDESVTGSTTFNTTGGSKPSITLTPLAATPTVGVNDGSIFISDGLLYAYDAGRGKFLSQGRAHPLAGRSGRTSNTYIQINGVPTSTTGYIVIRDATITAVSLAADNPDTWTLEIRKNGALTPILSLASGGAVSATSLVSNVDVSPGDEIQFYVNGTGINSPTGMIELAWRAI